MGVKFTNNSAKVKGALNDAVSAYLHEAGGELEAQVKRNSRVGSGQLKNSWTYNVDDSKGICTVGSPLENAIWEEFGTGEYALKGNGRKGGWIYKDFPVDEIRFKKGNAPIKDDEDDDDEN